MTNRLGKFLDNPYLALLFVTEVLFLKMVTNNPVELGNNGGSLVFLHITAVCLLQMAILAMIHRVVQGRGGVAVHVHRVAFAAILVFNIYAVLLVHIPSDDRLYAYRGHISFVLLLIILLLFSVKPWRLISASSLAFGMIVGIEFLFEEIAAEPENVAMPKMAEVASFKRHPNVYFFSFDALIPTDVVDFFLHQPEPEYSIDLKQRDFREVKNAFATSVPTRPSLNTIAAVDTRYCKRLGEDCMNLVIGKYPSPLYAVFRKNGYRTVFGYKSDYFGRRSGPYLDQYIVETFSICRHIDEGWAFLGYCWLERIVNLKSVFGTRYPIQSFQTLIAGSAKSSPHFVMMYIYSPGHTPKSYDTYSPSDFRKYQDAFRKGQLKTKRQLAGLINAVKTRDPNSVMIIFGDHGAWISRSWERKRGEADPAGKIWSEDMVILERHRVALFVYPKDFCVDEISGTYTLNRLGRSVAKCLSGGRDPFRGRHRDGKRDWSRYVLPK